jgi:hypothetical protein
METKCPNQVFYDWLVLNRGRKRDLLQIMILLYVGSTWSIVELKMHFETWITWNDVNGISLFHLSYIITRMAYMCTQRTQKVQIKCFMFEWSIYRLFVTNKCWKRDYLEIITFVYVWSTWGIIELKTRFGSWITRNDVMVYVCFIFPI